MKRLSLEDKGVVDSFYRRAPTELGYLSFAGEISVNHGHRNNVYYEVLGDSLFYIEESPEDGERTLIPVFLEQELASRPGLIRGYMEAEGISSVAYVDSAFVKSLEKTLKLHPDSDSEHEAIYPIERFSEFKGVDSQRRQANIFFRNNFYAYSFSPYDRENGSSLIQLAKDWERDSQHPTEGCDVRIAEFFVKNSSALGILGFNLLMDREVAAYAFGEKIKDNTFVIYAIKANRKFRGIYQAFWNLMCSSPELESIQFINNTNLTDVQGLRESKLRLKPERMVVPWVGELL